MRVEHAKCVAVFEHTPWDATAIALCDNGKMFFQAHDVSHGFAQALLRPVAQIAPLLSVSAPYIRWMAFEHWDEHDVDPMR